MGFNPVDLALGNMNALRVSNAKLKAENESFAGIIIKLEDATEQLEAENAELRELVRDVMPIVCDECHEHLCKMPKEEHPFVTCWFADRMCELGVEAES